MKTIANRLIVLAAGAIAFGTVAFGQTRMTAQIPFAFHTVNGTLPAGTYELSQVTSAGIPHAVVLRNTATQQSAFAGNPLVDVYRKASDAGRLEFLCGRDGCSLKAIRTSAGSLEYATPHKSKDKVAVIAVPLKALNAD